MKIFVKVKPSSRSEKVIKTDENHFIVSVTAHPEKGKATQAAVKAIAVYLGVKYLDIAIVSGMTSRDKVFEIL